MPVKKEETDKAKFLTKNKIGLWKLEEEEERKKEEKYKQLEFEFDEDLVAPI
jgi:hypothetical protein